jgi:hypothetical protein
MKGKPVSDKSIEIWDHCSLSSYHWTELGPEQTEKVMQEQATWNEYGMF